MAEKGGRGTEKVQKTKGIRRKGESRQRRKGGACIALINLSSLSISTM